MFEDIIGKTKKKPIQIDINTPCPNCGQIDCCTAVKATGTTRRQWLCDCWKCGHAWIMNYKEAGA